MSWPTWLPLRAELAPLTPYGAPQLPAQASLNTNENPYPPSPELQSAIAQAVLTASATLNRYPDRDAEQLRTSLAGYINERDKTGFTINNIWAANGSNEIIQSLFLAFGGANAVGFTPSYSMHPLIAKVVGTHWIDGKRNTDLSFNLANALESIISSKPALTFITSPNNPTGDEVQLAEIATLAKTVALHGGVLVVDEAYAEFSINFSATSLIGENPHVVVIRTMSKAFAFAGARVGYLVADSVVVDAMKLVRLPYHLSAITQAAAIAALAFRDELLGNVSRLIQARAGLIKSLNALGLASLPTSSNFILFTGFTSSAGVLWQQLLDKGVLIRDVGLPGYLRVSVGTDEENLLFISALTELL